MLLPATAAAPPECMPAGSIGVDRATAGESSPPRTPNGLGSTKAAGGSPWTLRNGNGSLSIPATVPGVVHLDLLRAEKIAEPYYRFGELELAWVYREQWTYSRTIAAGALGAAQCPGGGILNTLRRRRH